MGKWNGHWTGPSLADIREVGNGASAERVRAHSSLFQLSRPAIIENDALPSLTNGVATVMKALIRLPQILGDGDIRRFWSLLEYDQAKQDLIAIGHRADMFGQLGRCDVLRDETGFKILEVNASSAIGGLNSRILADAYFQDPQFTAYIEKIGLRWNDPAKHIVCMLQQKFPDIASGPVAILDSPESYAIFKQMHDTLADVLTSYGMECFSGSLSDVVVHHGKASCMGRRFTAAYRVFQARELMSTPEKMKRWTWLLSDLEAAGIPVIIPLSSTGLSDKRSLALLQSKMVWHFLTPDEQDAVTRMLPRSIIVGPNHSIKYQDHSKDWLHQMRNEIVLKPGISSSSKGIIFGRDVTQETWEALLASPPPGGYVAQQIVDPIPELCPEKNGSESVWQIQLGAFYLWGDVMVSNARGMRAGLSGPMRSLYLGSDLPPADAALGSLTLVAS